MSARERLKAWREAQGLSQGGLADRLACAQSLVSAIERGEKRPGLKIAIAIQRVTSEDPAEAPILATDWMVDPALDSEPLPSP